jgi:hypothetical protein
MLAVAVLLVASLVGAYVGTVTSQSDEAAVIAILWNSVLAMFIAHFLVLLSSHDMNMFICCDIWYCGSRRNVFLPSHTGPILSSRRLSFFI